MLEKLVIYKWIKLESCTVYKNQLIVIKVLDVKFASIKLLEYSIGDNFFDVAFAMISWFDTKNKGNKKQK